MNGAELALRTAAAAGVEVCFANPGTTELELVAALDAVPSMRAVLGLFEGVVTGAADGYGRAAGRPALTLLHLGPGLANGIANLHNARRAHTPVVNLVGDHATWHRPADAPLTTDIESLARPVSDHLTTMPSGARAATTMLEAVAAATGPPSGVATVIVPQDAAWGQAHVHDLSATEHEPFALADEAVRTAASRLGHPGTAMLLGGTLRRADLDAAARIQQSTGCRVWTDTFPAVVEQGAGLPCYDALPYFPDRAGDELGEVDTLVVSGTREPVAFFGYEEVARSRLLRDDTEVVTLAPPGVRAHVGLDAVAEELGLPGGPARVRDAEPVPSRSGGLDVHSLGEAVAALQPEGAIVVNEAATSSHGWAARAPCAPPHEVYALTGGAIGQGLPCAVGAAVAAPGRKVIALQADGAGLYTLQALWTMARESLDVTVVVCANRLYRILQIELHRTGQEGAGPKAFSLTELDDPAPDWVSLARGFGVEAVRASSVAELRAGLERGLASDGPFLVEAMI